MVAKNMSPEEILSIAVKIEDPVERAALLDAMCREDKELRAEVDSLLKAHDEAGDFMAAPVVEAHVTLDDTPLTEGPGTIIGKYKLLEKIGEGGMGVVYMAEQKEPVRRKVALKIIKLGMDTKQVIARFEAERQALALMDHPNIAKVLDAGATDTGRPYFVMELVRGIPITEYCDKNNLNTRHRLDLFIPICHAIQHAHQKGVIHRDIKPTNIMVTLHSSKPVPKIIDFGIAKATNQQLTEKTLFTRYAQMIGTPEYMSPEQAEMSGLDIDTRSDIYSLGVLLYELLTGATPLDADTLRNAGYAQMQQIIREEEPSKPSTKLSTLGPAVTEIAKHRSTQPDSLRKLIKGDLDWIIMKALEKDLTRRYDTATELAADIERHINHEPVSAAAPSLTYKLTKFTHRNRSLVASAAAVLIVLIAGIISSIAFATWANHERNFALQKGEEALIAKKLAEELRAEEVRLREQDQENMAFIMQALSFLPSGPSGSQLNQTFDLLKKLSHEFPDIPDHHRELVINYVKIVTSVKTGQNDQAQDVYQSIQALIKKLQTMIPKGSEYRLLPALIHQDLGMMLTKSRRADKGIEYYRQAADLSLDLTDELPEAYKLLNDIAQQCHLWAQNLFAENQWGGNYYEHWGSDWYHVLALNIQKKLVDDFPDEAEYRERLANYCERASTQAWKRATNTFNGMFSPIRAVEVSRSVTEAVSENDYFWETRGLAHYWMGQYKDAIYAINKSVEVALVQGNRENYRNLILAMSYAQLDDKVEAHRNYDKVIDWINRNYLPTLQPFKLIFTEAEVLLEIPETEMIYLEDYYAWYSRGRAYARQGQYERAVLAYEKSLELSPTYRATRWPKVMAHLAMGDIEGYRRTCAAKLKLSGSTTNSLVAQETALLCLYTPNATEDWSVPLRLLKFAASVRTYPDWNTYTGDIGVVLYRAGQYEEAIDKINEEINSWSLTGRPRMAQLSWFKFFLAMAHHQLGHTAQAHQFLQEAQTELEKELNNSKTPFINDWDHLLWRKLIQQEAEELINSPPRAAEPIRPNPADRKDIGNPPEIRLSWIPGVDVTAHNVYFGTDPANLKPLSQTPEDNSIVSPDLQPCQKYYWRVDAVKSNGSEFKGDLWSFTTGDLIGWWKLDEARGGNIADSSSYGHHGVISGDPNWTSGKFGSALNLDGIDDCVKLLDLDNQSNCVTITAWLKRNGDQTPYAGIVFHRLLVGNTSYETAGFCFGLNNELRYNWSAKPETYDWDSGLVIPDNQWVFTALVVEPEKATIYLHDGSQLQQKINTVQHEPREIDLFCKIGYATSPTLTDSYYKGQIDDVRLYSYALTESDIQNLYQGVSTGPPKN